MAATIEIYRTLAYVANGKWYSADAKLAVYLNGMSEGLVWGGSVPDSDNWLAQAIIDQEGMGRIVSLNPPHPDVDQPDPIDLVY